MKQLISQVKKNKASAYLDHLSCVRSANSYLNYIVASLNAHKKIRAAVLMYSYCIDCLFQQSTLHALCSSRLLCCSICTTWHRQASPCLLSAITACSSATIVTLCQSTCPEASWSPCPRMTPCSFTSLRSAYTASETFVTLDFL